MTTCDQLRLNCDINSVANLQGARLFYEIPVSLSSQQDSTLSRKNNYIHENNLDAWELNTQTIFRGYTDMSQ